MSAPAQSQQDSTSDSGRGYYVYGIVPEDVEPTDEASGVGDPPARVDVIRHGEIAALVSVVDVSRPLGRPDDLMAHQRLLDASAAEAPVLPVRFGAVLDSSRAVVDELLAPHHDEFAAALEDLEGHAEYVVKGRYVQDAVLREILTENADAARLRDDIRGTHDENATRDARIRLGELVTQAISAKREQDTRTLADAVSQVSAARTVREPTHEEDAVHVALLVDTDKQEELEEAVDSLARDWDGRVDLRLLGPMAPYDFITAPAPED
jgi:hypothetical protein